MAWVVGWLVGIVIVGTVWVVVRALAAMPEAVSAAARDIDTQLLRTLLVTGAAFVIVQGLLALWIVRYRDRRTARAHASDGHAGVEWGGAVFVAIVFLTLAVLGQQVWAKLHLSDRPADIVIEVTGEQFAWNVRYPGADARFGRNDPQHYDAGVNPLGLDPSDVQGNDDVVILNELVVPVDRTVELRLGSKDVLHSFFVPVLRIKQDTVPGSRIPLRFHATRVGTWEFACAELCGLGHYRMRGTFRVVTPSEYEAWLAELATE